MKKKTKVGMILKTILKVADNMFVGGAIHNVIEENTKPKGKLDTNNLVITLLSASIPTLLVLALLFKVITVEELIMLLNKVR